ncbi:MAG: GxxExxY protein [Ignavibacteriae bacterium]|nr:GxxExxY protein [Ignavibacteriota bacterium]
MSDNKTELLHSKETEIIIAAFYKVYNTLGFGFLEKVYENSLCNELQKSNLSVIKQYPINVYYDDQVVGEYFADLLIDKKIIVEIKTAKSLCQENEYQLINYLKATGIEVGLLLNFGEKAEFRRKIFTNDVYKSVDIR